MKKLLPLAVLVLFFTSCKKDKDNNETPTNATYINTAAGSSWTYHEVNNSSGTPEASDYTVTSTSRDTTIEGKSYHIYAYSYGGFQYLNKTNSDYYQYDSIAGIGNAVSRLYLKAQAKVGDTWTQSVNVTIQGFQGNIPVKLTNKIIDKADRTVNGTAYSNVIHVQSTISSTLIPKENLTSAIDTYYAENYGLIESHLNVKLNYLILDENIDVSLTLTGADLK